MVMDSVEATAARWTAKGFTDDVTECGHCGRTELKGTVRMVVVDADGNDDGDMYMGVVCAARMTGRKAGEIRTEANRADRARDEARRAAHRAWSDAHTVWFITRRDAALGPDASTHDILTWSGQPENRAAEAAWYAAHPDPTTTLST
jgi:hypothetical protein